MEDKELMQVDGFCPTPFYVFDERIFAQQVARMRGLLPSKVQLCYAMKANPFMTESAARLVERVEACSSGEARICLAAGVLAHQIVVSGIVKDASLIRDLVESHADIGRFTCESEAQFLMLERMAREENARVHLLMRLSSGNQFGMDAETVKRLIRDHRASRFVDVHGIQYFAGTQRSSPVRIAREIEKLDCLIDEIKRECGVGIMELEYGPGFPVEYFEHDAHVAQRAEDEPIRALAEALKNMRFSGTVILELGRSLVATCGTYVTQVLDVKNVGGQNFAIVDGGMHQIAYYGHAMAMRQPPCELLAAGKANGGDLWTVCGSLCTANDILVKQAALGIVEVGDLLAFHKAGAYCMTEGLSLFLSRDLPSVVLCDEKGYLHLARARTETAALNTCVWQLRYEGLSTRDWMDNGAHYRNG